MNNTQLWRKGLAVAVIAGLAWATPSMAQTTRTDQPSSMPSTTDKPSSMPSTTDKPSSMPSTSDQSSPRSPSTVDKPAGSLSGDVKDVQGQIQRVEGNRITLADGTELMIPESIQVQREELKEGASVKASYEERAGQKFVTSIEVDPSTK